MKKTIKRYMSLLLATMMMVLLVACGQREDTTTLSVSVGIGEIPRDLDPALITTETQKTIVVHLFENLMKLSENGVVNACAKNYTCTDNLDGTEKYEFKLREDIYWSNDKPVTAGDFVYAWKRLADPATGSPHRGILSIVAGFDEVTEGDTSALKVSAPDDLTFIVELNCHCPYFISDICTAAETMPVSADVAKRDTWSTQKSTLRSNGAYTIRDWKMSEMTIVESKKYYDTKKLGPEILNFKFFETDEEAVQAFLNNEVDYVIDVSVLPETVDKSLFEATDYPTVSMLIFNDMSSMMQFKDLRLAMSKVINRYDLIDDLPGARSVSDGIIPYGILASSGGQFRELNGPVIDNNYDDTTYEDECTAAIAKLNNVIIESDGSTMNLGTLKLLYEGNEVQTKTAEYLIQTWQDKLGITITATAAPEGQLYDYISDGDYSLALLTLTSDRNDASGIFGRLGSNNDYGIYNEVMLQSYRMLMRAADASTSTEARDAYYADAEQLLIDGCYVIPLYSDIRYCGKSDKLMGIFDDGMGVHYLTSVRHIVK